jgi:signal transduction histidine kinase
LTTRPSQAAFTAILASVAHDVKNSLGMMIGTLENAMAACPPEGCVNGERLPLVLYEAMRANHQLVQLLALYRIGNDQYSLNLGYHPVAGLLEECVLQSRPLLDVRGIAVEVSCPQGLHGFFDRELVEGVLGSVLANGLRYTRGRLHLAAWEEDGGLALAVDDDGHGYPSAMLAAGEAQPGELDLGRGHTGLGLHFARVVAELHRNRGRSGHIALSNGSPLGGGRFLLYLP